jgi:uncharacterized protein
MADSVQSFSEMLRSALGSRLAVDATSFVEMFSKDGIMEFPYAPPGMPDRLEGRNALAQHLNGLADQIVFDWMEVPIVHDTTDPGVVILEFRGGGRGVATGERYDQTYISVIRVRDGHIIHYRDYWNPLAALRAIHGRPFVVALEAGGAGHG